MELQDAAQITHNSPTPTKVKQFADIIFTRSLQITMCTPVGSTMDLLSWEVQVIWTLEFYKGHMQVVLPRSAF